ncbi:MAG: radical SAM family heme chaperone HemW [Planctomycetaceae bacterium]
MPSLIAALRPPRAGYIHVPFCAHRCGYCDFTLVARKDHLIDDYLRALAIELQSLESPPLVETLFLGGGTPTHLSAPQLERLLLLVRAWFQLAPAGEFSVEANPAGLDDEKLDVLAAAGVNRVSLGAQSFDAKILRILERDHDERTIVDVWGRLGRRFDNLSLDLIFGVPGQSLELWRATLAQAIALEPQHISTYGLTFEKGTTFWSRREKGALASLPDVLEREMYAAAMDDLSAAGFDQYELSNFARAGFACRHNATYWAGLGYYGFGPGAARYVAGRRETNHRSVTTWLTRVLSGRSPVGDSEELEAEPRAREALALGLRRIEGVGRAAFAETTGFELAAVTSGRIERHVAAGLVEDDPAGVRLTREGRFLADSVVGDVL